MSVIFSKTRVVVYAVLGLILLSCKPEKKELNDVKMPDNRPGQICVAIISGYKQADTGVLVEKLLRTNGIRGVVEGSLEHYVRVPTNDAAKAIHILKATKQLEKLPIRILESN